MVADIFEDFEPLSKKFLALPLIWSSSYNRQYIVDNLTDLIKEMSISEGFDRCVNDFTNINEDMVVDQKGSHQLMEKRPEDEAKGDGKGVRKYTKKGLQYQRSVLMEKRSQIHKRLMRKSSIIGNLLYSKQNLIEVKENLGQFDDIFKLLTDVHQQHCKLLSEEEQDADNQWFEDVDEMVFSFKPCVYNWVRENEEDKKKLKKF